MLQRDRQVIGVNNGWKRSAHPFGQGPACDGFKTRVQRGNPPVRRKREDNVLRVLDQTAIPLFRLAERHIGFAKASVGHLKWRQRFREEILRRLADVPDLFRRPDAACDRRQRVVVQRRHFQDAEAFSEGLTPQLIGKMQVRFPSILQVIVQGPGILVPQNAQGVVHGASPT